MSNLISLWKQQGYDKNGDGVIDVEDLKLISPEDVVEHIFRLYYWNRRQADRILSQALANIQVDWVRFSGRWGIVMPILSQHDLHQPSGKQAIFERLTQPFERFQMDSSGDVVFRDVFLSIGEKSGNDRTNGRDVARNVSTHKTKRIFRRTKRKPAARPSGKSND